MSAYDVADADRLDGEGLAGMVRKVRPAVGAKASRYLILPPNQEGHEHDIGAPLDRPYEPPSWG
ncbi:MAG TPA: hypothetical protein VFU26_06530 [Gaiellaceae bacterium]|nr:hypothetical protein [Gaiellaceae bacterium]